MFDKFKRGKRQSRWHLREWMSLSTGKVKCVTDKPGCSFVCWEPGWACQTRTWRSCRAPSRFCAECPPSWRQSGGRYSTTSTQSWKCDLPHTAAAPAPWSTAQQRFTSSSREWLSNTTECLITSSTALIEMLSLNIYYVIMHYQPTDFNHALSLWFTRRKWPNRLVAKTSCRPSELMRSCWVKMPSAVANMLMTFLQWETHDNTAA